MDILTTLKTSQWLNSGLYFIDRHHWDFQEVILLYAIHVGKRVYNSLLALFSVSSFGANMLRKSAANNSIQMLYSDMVEIMHNMYNTTWRFSYES